MQLDNMFHIQVKNIKAHKFSMYSSYVFVVTKGSLLVGENSIY